MLPTKDNFEYKHTEWVKVIGWKKIYCTNSKHKKAKREVSISVQIHFKTKVITRDRDIL